jgi:taurine transport system permease protein
MGVARDGGIFDPPIEFYRPLPPPAYLPPIVIVRHRRAVETCRLSAFAPFAMSARAGVRSVSQRQIHAAYLMGATKRQVIFTSSSRRRCPRS